MPDAHRRRRDEVRRRLAGMSPAAPLVVTNLANVRYLTGFSGSNAILVLASEASRDVIATDGRYVDQVASEAGDLPAIIDRATLSGVLDALAPGPVMVEQGLTMSALRAIESLRGVPTVVGPMIEELRCLKDPSESSSIAEACRITARAFEALADEIRVGMTELSLARRLEQFFAEGGAEDRAFPTIVASGAHSAIPHHRPGPTALREGDLLVVDAGARFEGYHADMTRTWVVGREPEPWQSDLHACVLAAQSAAIAAIEPGREARAIDRAARDVLGSAGLEERFTHGLGHGVGLEIHEAPSVGALATGSIEASMAFTVEPGVYLPDQGGVRIEDTLVVTDAGPHVLTESPRGLRVVGV